MQKHQKHAPRSRSGLTILTIFHGQSFKNRFFALVIASLCCNPSWKMAENWQFLRVNPVLETREIHSSILSPLGCPGVCQDFFVEFVFTQISKDLLIFAANFPLLREAELCSMCWIGTWHSSHTVGHTCDTSHVCDTRKKGCVFRPNTASNWDFLACLGAVNKKTSQGFAQNASWTRFPILSKLFNQVTQIHSWGLWGESVDPLLPSAKSCFLQTLHSMKIRSTSSFDYVKHCQFMNLKPGQTTCGCRWRMGLPTTTRLPTVHRDESKMSLSRLSVWNAF